jgi:aspartyl-tRNA(Asn)/glutamyl-tRNA(Gln) amidotransferase subunit A
MSKDGLCELGVAELARLYRRAEISPVEVIDAHLQRAEELNPLLNAFLLLLKDSARQAAKAAEALFRAGIDLGPLQGVPISIKDLIRIQGTRTTAGSRILLQAGADPTDAWIVRRLREAGAVIIGKTNLHEFASGDPDPDGPFGLVQNPRRIGYHPGSSSSGAGAAVAAGIGTIAIGTDSGGSVRIPACLCGVAGLKPTTGRISLEGIIPLSSTVDTVGPLGRRVSDVAAAFSVCTTKNSEDAVSSWENFLQELEGPVSGWRVGIPPTGFFRKVQPAVEGCFHNTLKVLQGLGCQLADFQPPEAEAMPDLLGTIIQAEGSAYHQRYAGKEDLYAPGFRERVLQGREIKATFYIEALAKMREIQQKWLKLMDRYDVVIVPGIPSIAPKHGATTIEIQGESFPFRALLGRFTRPFNLLGWPALTVPNGVSPEGLPTGVQIAGKPDQEMRLFTLGNHLESVLGFVPKLGIEPRQAL